MPQNASEHVRAAKVYLRCPHCGSADMATTAQLTASCQGHAVLTIAGDGECTRESQLGGWSDVNWDSSTTVGIECRSCTWSYIGDGHLEQLATDNTEELS